MEYAHSMFCVSSRVQLSDMSSTAYSESRPFHDTFHMCVLSAWRQGSYVERRSQHHDHHMFRISSHPFQVPHHFQNSVHTKHFLSAKFLCRSQRWIHEMKDEHQPEYLRRVFLERTGANRRTCRQRYLRGLRS